MNTNDINLDITDLLVAAEIDPEATPAPRKHGVGIDRTMNYWNITVLVKQSPYGRNYTHDVEPTWEGKKYSEYPTLTHEKMYYILNSCVDHDRVIRYGSYDVSINECSLRFNTVNDTDPLPEDEVYVVDIDTLVSWFYAWIERPSVSAKGLPSLLEDLIEHRGALEYLEAYPEEEPSPRDASVVFFMDCDATAKSSIGLTEVHNALTQYKDQFGVYPDYELCLGANEHTLVLYGVDVDPGIISLGSLSVHDEYEPLRKLARLSNSYSINIEVRDDVPETIEADVLRVLSDQAGIEYHSRRDEDATVIRLHVPDSEYDRIEDALHVYGRGLHGLSEHGCTVSSRTFCEAFRLHLRPYQDSSMESEIAARHPYLVRDMQLDLGRVYLTRRPYQAEALAHSGVRYILNVSKGYSVGSRNLGWYDYKEEGIDGVIYSVFRKDLYCEEDVVIDMDGNGNLRKYVEDIVSPHRISTIR